MNLLDLARLHPHRTTGRVSSWDTTERNADHWIIAPGERRVLADIEGPGTITHIWMTQREHYRECLLLFTWDDAPEPGVAPPPVAQRLPIPRDADGTWLRDAVESTPGTPVTMTDEMRTLRAKMESQG